MMGSYTEKLNRQRNILKTDTDTDVGNLNTEHTHACTHNRLTAFGPGLPGWASTRRNTHPLTRILVIGHPLLISSIYYDP